MLPSYYGMRLPVISDSDFCPSAKQFSPDVYSSTFGGKPLGSECTSYSSSLIDAYYPESFGDYRSTAGFSSSGGSYLPSSSLSTLLPPFSGESSHLFLVGLSLLCQFFTLTDMKFKPFYRASDLFLYYSVFI